MAWTNSSARIATIQDVRATGSGNYYSFTYTNAHLSSITNSLGTAEAYTFGYTGSTLADPFSAVNYGSTNLLTSMQQTPTTMTTSFNYGTNGSGEMNSMTTQYGGSLSWVHSSSPAYSNSRYLREVSSRVLVKQLNATPATYPITYGSNATVVHASGSVKDPDGHGEKVWLFDTNSANATVGLALNHYDHVNYGTDTGGKWTGYTFATNASGNLFVGTTASAQDVALASQLNKYTTQAQDQYGNVTQVQVSNYYVSWSQQAVVRTYTNTYLTDSHYTNLHIVNRLTGSSVTSAGGATSSTLATVSYDYDSTNGILQAVPGITAHDAAYECNYGATGCTTYYRGNPTTISQPGNTTGLSHDFAGNVIFSNTNGVITRPTINNSMNYTVPTAITTGSFTTNLGFNSFLGLTNETGPNGDSLGIGYDAAARPASTTSPFGAYTIYTYNDTATPPTHVAITTATSGSHGTRTTLDGFGRTIKAETGPVVSGTFTPSSVVDTMYGSCGCSPLGKLMQTSMPYAPGGTPVYTTYAYDGMGRTLTQTAPDGSVTHYAYAGNSVSVTDPAGKWKQYYMDSLGNVSMVVEPNPDANPTSPPAWSYAAYTQNPALSNGTYHLTNYAYDVLNHLTQVSMPRYNASNQVTTTQTRSFNYTLNNGVGALLLSATNPENGTVTYTYTGNLLYTKTDAKNQKTQYTYDSYNRPTQVQHFLLQIPFNNYVEDVSQRVLYTYDSGTNAAGRLTGINYQPMSNGFQQPTFSETYTYSAAGSVLGKQLGIAQAAGSGYPAGGLTLSSSFTYDNEGKMTSVTYPSVSNHSATFTTTYDAMSRPSYLADQANDFIINNVTYGAANQLLTMGYANCVGCQPYIESRGYNSRLQLTGIGSQQYIYGANGTNNGKVVEAISPSGEDVVYQYDALNRLSLAGTNPTWDQQHPGSTWGQWFAYDGFGNLYQKNVFKGLAPPLAASANPATNQLYVTGYEAYDANGNWVYETGNNGPAVFYGFDVENRMASVNQSGASNGVATYWYGYDPGNRRVWKGTYDSNGNLTAQEAYFYTPTGQKLGTYGLNFTGTPNIATATDIQVFFGGKRVGHAMGYTLALSGTIQDRVGSYGSYFPYGEDKGSPIANDQMKFATYTRDSATGLDYAMNRYYSSAWGRFTTPDPYTASGGPGDSRSWNRYVYTRSDPVNSIDASGLQDCSPDAPDCWSSPADPRFSPDQKGPRPLPPPKRPSPGPFPLSFSFVNATSVSGFNYASECGTGVFGAFATETFQILDQNGQPLAVSGLTVEEEIVSQVELLDGVVIGVSGPTGWVPTTRPGPTTTNASGQFLDSPFGGCVGVPGVSSIIVQAYRVLYNGTWYYPSPTLFINLTLGLGSETVTATGFTSSVSYGFTVGR